MSDLLREICDAQVRAGEDAVMRHLAGLNLADKQAEPAVAELEAAWSISLDTTCPGCKKEVDLLDHSDFWEGRRIDPIENHTRRANNLSVVCPECSHEFKVRCVY